MRNPNYYLLENEPENLNIAHASRLLPPCGRHRSSLPPPPPSLVVRLFHSSTRSIKRSPCRIVDAIIDATAPPPRFTRVSPVYRINAVERAARVFRIGQPEGSLPGSSTVNRRGIRPLTNSDRKDNERIPFIKMRGLDRIGVISGSSRFVSLSRKLPPPPSQALRFSFRGRTVN